MVITDASKHVRTQVDIEAFAPGRCRWSRWIERLEMAFDMLGAVDGEKQTYLLHYMGQETYNVLCDRLAPVKPKTKTYTELVEILMEHFEPEPLEIVENYRFHLRKQLEGEKISDFMVELRKLSIHCKFGSYLDTALRNQLVFGVRSHKIQNRLLEVKDLTLKKAFEMATAMELSERGGAELHQTKPETVHLVTQRTKPRAKYSSKEASKGSTSSSNGNSEKRGVNAASALKCYRCGGSEHLANKCRFRKAVCSQCKTVGHLARVCQKSGHTTHNITAITTEDLFNLSDRRGDKIFTDVLINNVSLSLELDTGAPVTIIGLSDAKKFFKKQQIHPADRRLSSYCGAEIKVYGYMVVSVKSMCDAKELKLYVVDSTKPPLLGREWLRELRLNWKSIFEDQTATVNAIESTSTQKRLDGLVTKYAKIFESTMGCIVGVKARLRLKSDATPRFMKSRRIPFAIKEAVEKELDELTAQGILEKVDTAEWATPIVPVRKANNKIRICGDYKVTVNPQLVVEEYPLPTIDELFASMAGGKKFSKIDLSQAYLQMQVHENDRDVLTLNTHKGLYRPTRLMYGIASAPAKFQGDMETALKDIEGVSVFIDDIKVTATDDHKHLERLEEVFSRLTKLNMRVNLNKCEFLADSIEYCGYRIDQAGIHKMENKVVAIADMPAPTDRDKLRTFCGMVNYYGRFMENLSTTMYPLNNLLKDDVNYEWTAQCQSAFEAVKNEMKSNKVLVHFDPSLPVLLATDASPYGIGATLSHRYPDGSERPIQHASQTLTEVQQRYSQIDKEALAVVYGVKKYHQYLYGRKFKLVVDNQPIMQIFSPQKGLPTLTATRMQHYAIFLEAYDFDIEYKRSKDHANVDALSRLPVPECTTYIDASEVLEMEIIDNLPVLAEELVKATEKDAEAKSLLAALKTGRHCEAQQRFGIPQTEFSMQNGILLRGIRAYIPNVLRKRILDELHTSHFGMSRMKALARAYCWWPGLDADIDRLVLNCALCQQHRANPPQTSTHIWESASAPFERVHVDFAGPFLGKYFFILVDAYSKWPEVHIIPNITTEVTIDVCRKIFSTFGTPSVMVSDRGSQFMSAEFQLFLKQNGIEHRCGAPYHPATNGQAERYVRTFKEKLKLLKCKPSEIATELSKFLLAYRRTVHPATGQSPAMAMFNRQIKSRLDLLFKAQTKAPSASVPQRTFAIGERVGARDYLGQNKWLFGSVVEKYGALHYDILLDDGRKWRRHADQIIRIGTEIAPSAASALPIGTPFSSTSSSSTVDNTITVGERRANSPAQSTSSSSSPSAPPSSADTPPSPHIVTGPSIQCQRHSARTIRAPIRLNYTKLGSPRSGTRD